MKKILTIFFVTLGVIFFLILLFIAYAFAVDMFGIRTALSGGGMVDYKSLSQPSGNDGGATTTEDNNSVMNAEQKKALESFGIDTSQLPSQITPEMEACFEAKLGKERVAEIKAGASPTATDFFKARDCI